MDALSIHHHNRANTIMVYVFVVLSLKRSANTTTVIGLIIIMNIVDSLGLGYVVFAPDLARVIGRYPGARRNIWNKKVNIARLGHSNYNFCAIKTPLFNPPVFHFN